MSRAVVCASPLVPAVICRLVIMLLHRAVGRLMAASKKFSRAVEGEKILMFEDGVFLKEHMKKSLGL